MTKMVAWVNVTYQSVMSDRAQNVSKDLFLHLFSCTLPTGTAGSVTDVDVSFHIA